MTAQPVHKQQDEDLAEDQAAFEAAMRGEYVSHDAVKRWLASKDTEYTSAAPGIRSEACASVARIVAFSSCRPS